MQDGVMDKPWQLASMVGDGESLARLHSPGPDHIAHPYIEVQSEPVFSGSSRSKEEF